VRNTKNADSTAAPMKGSGR